VWTNKSVVRCVRHEGHKREMSKPPDVLEGYTEEQKETDPKKAEVVPMEYAS